MPRIALAQINTTVGDLQGNAGKILRFADRARRQGAHVVIFPEMTLCGYPPEDLLFKEHFIRDTQKALGSLVKDIKGLSALVGFVDRDDKGSIYNAAALIRDGRIKGVYHKHFLPNYGVFDEKRYFREGKDYLILDHGPMSMGISICEDIWQNRGIPRVYAKAGVDVLVNMSASPYDFGKLEQRKKMLKARAQETQSYICYVNLIGGQDELVFDGGSLVLDKDGRIVAAGKQFGEDLVLIDVMSRGHKAKKQRPRGTKVVKIQEPPVALKPIHQKSPKALSQIERIFQALVLGTRDYVKKNGFNKVVVGLSGGIDSSLVAAIAREALGANNVVGVSMPSVFTSKGTRADAKKLAKNLGIKLIVKPIDKIFSSYTKALKKDFKGYRFDVAEENLQARIRGNILMAFSNKFGWLVLTTGNKSEVAVGYCTLYGDLSGGFAVIKDVPKTMVYALAKFINTERAGIIPKSILTRAPTAELRRNQKDQDSLPPYKALDELIKAYVEEHRSLKDITRKSKRRALIKKIVRMVDKSEYKRRQSPPGIKITPRAFGKDWRLPITNKYSEF